jgi:hypothetical protein
MDKNKMTFIPIDEVPYKKQTKWDRLFASIPKGQALVLEKSEVNVEAVRAALSRRQKKGQFKNLKLISRTVEGKIKSYVMNTDKK